MLIRMCRGVYKKELIDLNRFDQNNFPRIHSPNYDDINKYIKYHFINITSGMKNRRRVYLWE